MLLSFCSTTTSVGSGSSALDYVSPCPKSPKNSGFLDMLAQLQAQNKNFDQATATAQKAMEINPEDGDAVALYAALQVQGKQTANAIGVWEQWLKTHPNNAGVYAILGNHDWWADPVAQTLGHGPIAARKALESVGVPVLENDRIRLSKDGRSFWLAGLGDQLAFYGPRALSLGRSGVDDLAHALVGIPAEDPVILLVHEPDIFPQVPDRVAITLAGHTHGGQVRILGYAPLAPSPLSRRYLYGQFLEQGRRLIVSGGLGCSWWPVRFGAPPEIVLVEIGASDDAGRLAT